MEDEKLQARKKEFLNKEGPDISKERIDYASKLRKAKKDSIFNKKRNQIVNPTYSEIIQKEYDIFLTNFNPILSNPEISLVEKLKLVLQIFNSPIYDSNLLVNLLIFIRNSIMSLENSLIDLLFKEGFLTKLSLLLDISNDFIRSETIWIILNIASVNDTNYVNEMMKIGIHIKLISLLQLPNENIKEIVFFRIFQKKKTLWALGNFVNDSNESRSELLKVGLAKEVTKLISGKQIVMKVLENISWIILGFSQITPEPKLELVFFHEILIFNRLKKLLIEWIFS